MKNSKWARLGLRLRMMAYVTVGLVILFAGLAYFEMRAVRDLKEQIFRERAALAEVLAGRVEKNFEFLGSDILLIAERVRVPENDFQGIATEISLSLQQHAPSQFFAVSSIQLMDDQGRFLASEPPGASPHLPLIETAVRTTLAKNEPLVFPCDGASGEQAPFAVMVVPVSATWTANRPVAVVVETVGKRGSLTAIPGGGSGYSMEILGADGRIMVSTSEHGKPGTTSPHYAGLREYMNAGQAGVGIHRDHEADPADDLVVAVTPFRSSPFFLVLKQPADTALMVPMRQQNELFGVAAIALVLALVVAWYTTSKVVRPVEELRATARAFARGKLDSPVEVLAQDELAELAEDIEAMRQQLKTSRDDLQRAKLDLELKVAERTRRLQETLGKIITAQEEERHRLARELHDEQSQSLGALSVSLERAGRLLGPSSSELSTEIQQAREMARSLLKETRRLIYDLRPSVLDDMGLEAAIRWCAETHLGPGGIQVSLQNALGHRRLPGAMEVALFRVAQEAIVNIARHSQARHAEVAIEYYHGALRMRVSDDGKGFIPASAGNGSKSRGVGLEGMKERVRLMGGTIDISSEPGKGTIINLEVPFDKEALS